jgi:hypothetical protein
VETNVKSKYAARNCYRRQHGIPLDAKPHEFSSSRSPYLDRAVVLYSEHKSFPEIAALLGTSRQNVQQILDARRDRLFRWGQEQV